MTPGTSWLWILPTNRKKSVAFLNLFCGGFLLLDSATPLLVRVSKLQDAGPSEEDIAHMAEHFLLSSFMYVPCRAKRRCHCQYQSSPSTAWNWGETHEETQATISAVRSWWKQALVLTLLFSLWSILFSCPGRPFHAFVIPSIVPAWELVQLNHDSVWGIDPTENWFFKYFFPFSFFWQCYSYPLSILVHCVATRKLVPAKVKAQQKEASSTALEVLDFIKWKWSCGALEDYSQLQN